MIGLEPEQTSALNYYYVHVHGGATTGTSPVVVIATDAWAGTSDSAFYMVTVGTAAPPPPRPHTAPFVTIAAEQGDWRFKDTSKCLLDCFDVVRRFTTTPYVSLNTPRSLTFTQRRIGYQPAMMLEFDVADSSSSPADSFSVAIRRSNGSLMPLVYAVDMAPFGNGINTRDTVYYRRGGASRFRVAVSPSIATDATGVYDATAIISGIWSASEIKVRELPIHYVVRNDSASIFGKGVTLEGQQSLKHVSGGKLILDGSGGWTYFMRATPACVTACVYQHTPGDFSVLHDSVVAGAVVGYVRVYPDASQITFDAAGRILTGSDPSGNTTSYSYGTAYNTPVLTAVIDPAGKADSLRYSLVYDDVCGCTTRTLLSALRDPGGRVTSVSMSYQGDPVFVDPDGGGTALSAPWAMNDRLGNTWTSYGYALSTTKIWSTMGPRIVVQGQVTFPGWRVNPRERILYQPGATLAYPSFALNADTIHASVVDQNGNVTKYRLDGFGAATEILTADGARATAQRDLEGRLIQTITPRGDTLDYTWSGPYLIQAVDRHATPGGSTTINTYSPAVSDVAFTGGHAYSTRTTRDGIVLGTSWFNAHGVLDSARVGPDTSKSVTRYVADTRGRVIQVTDPRGHQSLTVYQSSGFQNTDSTYAPADVPTDVIGTRRYYDTYGRVVATRDNRLNRDTTAYDLVNRVLYTAKGARTITNTYDRLFLTSVNTNGLVTTYAPNGHGWVDSVTNPLGLVTYYGFDRNGNVLSTTNQSGQTVLGTYDALDRPLSITADGNTRTFFYDPQGRWSGAGRGANIDTIKTDVAGRDSVVVTVRGSRVYTQRVGYAMNGQRATHRLSSGSYDQLTTWAYNSYGQLDTLVGPSQHVPTLLIYNEDGLNIGRQAQGLTFSTGFSGVHAPSGLSYGFPSLNREYAYELGTGFLSDRIQGDSGTLYGYDDLGQLKNVYRYGVTDPAQDCGTVSDMTGQITPACKTRRSLSMTTLSAITYDGLGNRTDHAGQGYSLNNRQSYFNGTYYGYDGDGNISTKSGNGAYVVYTWSTDGELKKATRFGWNENGQYVQDSTTFTYDGFGRRIRKSSLTTGVHEYLLDGDNLLAELDSAGGIRAQYTYYPGVDNPHSVLFPGTGRTYNFATEAPGSVTGLTDTLGVLVASWSYDMWGVPTTLSGADSIKMPLRFAAREYDVETGLYYNRARYYDPQTGRFISEDPLGLAGGVNQYTYAGNNPVNATDPSGLFQIACEWGTSTTGSPGNYVSERYLIGCREVSGGGFPGRPGGLPTTDGPADLRPSGGTMAPADGTRVAPLADRQAVVRRLACTTGLTAASASTGAAGASVIGAVVGVGTVASSWSSIGGLVGGLTLGVPTDGVAAPAGFWVGRLAGVTAAALFGAQQGRKYGTTVGGIAGFGYAMMKCN